MVSYPPASASTAATRFRRTALVALTLALTACASSGLVVESVDNYNSPNNANLFNSIANGDGFIRAMTGGDGPWHVIHRYTDAAVWDTDFLSRADWDSRNFDPPGAAISYYTGHGFVTPYGENPAHRCTHSTQCTTPPTGASLPGVCKAAGATNYAPGDTPQCVYYSDRVLAVAGANDQFGGAVNYSGGAAAWGESPQSGGWRQVGTGGGTNVVVLDASFGALPTFWVRGTIQAMAGAHLLATVMPVTGDTANVATRGGFFGNGWAQNANGSVSNAWLVTMNSIAGSGVNGGGCNLVIAYDTTPALAQRHIDEDWSDIRNDGLDGKGKQFYNARWLCNWPSTITDASIFELK